MHDPSGCPLVEKLIHCLSAEQGSRLTLQNHAKVVPQDVPKIPNHIVRLEYAMHHGSGINGIRTGILLLKKRLKQRDMSRKDVFFGRKVVPQCSFQHTGLLRDHSGGDGLKAACVEQNQACFQNSVLGFA